MTSNVANIAGWLGNTEEPPGEEHRGQARIAYRLAQRHGARLRHVHQLGWYQWDGSRWCADDRGEATRAVLDTLRAALREAAELPNRDRDELLRDVRRSESAPGIEGVLRIASALETFALTVDQLDADPYLLNCRNGTLDLRTGQLHEHDPADLLTKVTGTDYDPTVPGPVFEQFLLDIQPDEQMRGYLQRLGGLGLLGKVVEHVLPITTGTGANGKSTLLSAISAAMGDYAIAADPDLLVDKGGTHPTGQMDLRGVRLAVCHESDEGRRLAIGTVKRLTGGDKIRARRMRRDFVEFDPSHTVVLVTNHKPRVPADDAALWRRLRIVPFDVVITDPDPTMNDKLTLELPAILTWLVDGYDQYAQNGLSEPQAVRQATDTYRASADALGRFIDDRGLVGEHFHVRARDLFHAWTTWCRENGEEASNENTFAAAMELRGHKKVRRNTGVLYLGIALETEEV